MKLLYVYQRQIPVVVGRHISYSKNHPIEIYTNYLSPNKDTYFLEDKSRQDLMGIHGFAIDNIERIDFHMFVIAIDIPLRDLPT